MSALKNSALHHFDQHVCAYVSLSPKLRMQVILFAYLYCSPINISIIIPFKASHWKKKSIHKFKSNHLPFLLFPFVSVVLLKSPRPRTGPFCATGCAYPDQNCDPWPREIQHCSACILLAKIRLLPDFQFWLEASFIFSTETDRINSTQLKRWT